MVDPFMGNGGQVVNSSINILNAKLTRLSVGYMNSDSGKFVLYKLEILRGTWFRRKYMHQPHNCIYRGNEHGRMQPMYHVW